MGYSLPIPDLGMSFWIDYSATNIDRILKEEQQI